MQYCLVNSRIVLACEGDAAVRTSAWGAAPAGTPFQVANRIMRTPGKIPIDARMPASLPTRTRCPLDAFRFGEEWAGLRCALSREAGRAFTEAEQLFHVVPSGTRWSVFHCAAFSAPRIGWSSSFTPIFLRSDTNVYREGVRGLTFHDAGLPGTMFGRVSHLSDKESPCEP